MPENLMGALSPGFLPPWEPLLPDQADAFQSELERELSAGHPLHGVALQAIARSRRADDALFQLENGCVADVHLTWSRKSERAPWPTHRVYSSLEEWQQHVMIPDHEDL
jgi:hypothetical protein